MRLNEEQRKLAEDNHNLIYFVLDKYGWSVEDYYGLAAIALCKAAHNYDPERRTAFSTYSVRAIKNEILSDKRKERSIKRSRFKTVSLNEKICFSQQDFDEDIE